MSHSAISMAESTYTTGPIRPWIWKRWNISVINRDRSETSRPMNAGPTSVVKAALVVGQATCPHPSPQPSTSASVQTRTAGWHADQVEYRYVLGISAADAVDRA